LYLVCGVLLLKMLFWLLAVPAEVEVRPPRKSRSDWVLDERPRRSLEKFEVFGAALVGASLTRERPRRSLERRLAAAGAGTASLKQKNREKTVEEQRCPG
jgi:hypothetical protein